MIFTLLLLVPWLLSAGTVTFLIKGIRSEKGKIILGIYDSEDSFLKRGKAISKCLQQGPIANGQVRVTCSLFPGTYAAGMFHDENDNDDIDVNFLGIPKEGYGFSNNAKGIVGLPDYKDAAFTVHTGDLQMEVTLKY